MYIGSARFPSMIQAYLNNKFPIKNSTPEDLKMTLAKLKVAYNKKKQIKKYASTFIFYKAIQLFLENFFKPFTKIF